MFARAFAWLTRPRSYVCGCGKRYRGIEAQSRCVWKHALEVSE